LWERARGKLHWERDVDPDLSSKQLLGVGDEAALKAFMEENREALVAEAARIRAAAQRTLDDLEGGTMPYTNAEWLTWLEEHDDAFRKLLREASARRKVFSRRVQADTPLPASARLQPESASHGFATWERKLAQIKPGFVCVKWGDEPRDLAVLFSCCLLKQVWGVRLARVGEQGPLFSLDVETNAADLFKPVGELLKAELANVADERVHVLELAVRREGGADPFHASGEHVKLILLRMHSATTVQLQLSASRKTNIADEGDGEESGDVCGEYFSGSDADLVSLASDAESDAENEAEEEGPASEADTSEDELVADPTTRAKAGTHTVFNNGYFTLSDDQTLLPGTSDRIYDDCKIRIAKTWLEELGKKNASKNAVFADFDDVPSTPVRSYIVLRAWMLGRFQEGGFHTKKKSRVKFLARETSKLRDDIAKLAVPGGGTGNDFADKKIRRWFPAAFA